MSAPTSPSPSVVPWDVDILGDGYEQQVFHLGEDPDGEGPVEAVLVRRTVREGEAVRGTALYVHGFSDYFFQTELADFFAERGFAFYGLDLRKCGRGRREGHTPHYVSDLATYDVELESSLEAMVEDHPDVPVVVVAHSTGGLITPLWLDRRARRGRVAPVAGLVLNSPWFDMQGSAVVRGPVTWALRAFSRLRPLRAMDLPKSTLYVDSLHSSRSGEWDFDLDLKPLGGFPVTVGWLNAVRRGHARLHRGLDVDVPALVLRSDKTLLTREPSPAFDVSDTVLDVRQIARWSGCLGGETTVVPVEDARHDVFLSQQGPRRRAYDVLDTWLTGHFPVSR